MINWKNIIKMVEITTDLSGAFLMAFRVPIVGLNHTGIATAVGIIGLGIIAAANKSSFRNEKGGT